MSRSGVAMNFRLRKFNKQRSYRRWLTRRRKQRLSKSDVEALSPNLLVLMEDRFHALIMQRAGHLVRDLGQALPSLKAPSGNPYGCFRVPGMYGGFDYELRRNGRSVVLLVESYCRVVGGSAQRHLITSAMTKLISSGHDLL